MIEEATESVVRVSDTASSPNPCTGKRAQPVWAPRGASDESILRVYVGCGFGMVGFGPEEGRKELLYVT